MDNFISKFGLTILNYLTYQDRFNSISSLSGQIEDYKLVSKYIVNNNFNNSEYFVFDNKLVSIIILIFLNEKFINDVKN